MKFSFFTFVAIACCTLEIPGYSPAAAEKISVDISDHVRWGALPVFIGGYGTPPYSGALYNVGAPWVCGRTEDLCVGVVG